MFRLFLFYYLFNVSFLTLVRSEVFDLEVITTASYNVPIAGALRLTGAALQLAAEAVNSNKQFSRDLNVSVTFLDNNDDQTCQAAESNAPRILAEYYNKKVYKKCVAIIASSKSTAKKQIPDPNQNVRFSNFKSESGNETLSFIYLQPVVAFPIYLILQKVREN
jgi:hypothetical protein